MEGTWRLDSTSPRLHPCEASIQKQCERCADTAWAEIDSERNLLVAKFGTKVEENYKIPEQQA